MTNDEIAKQLSAARKQLTRWIVLTSPLSDKIRQLQALERAREELLARVATLATATPEQCVAIAAATRALAMLPVRADEIDAAVEIARSLVRAICAS